MICVLTKEQLDSLLKKVAKDIHISLPTKEVPRTAPFNVKGYIDKVYKEVDAVSKEFKLDPDLALAYAQLIPSTIVEVLSYKPEFRKALTGLLSTDKMYELADKFEDIKYVSSYLNLTDSPIKTIQEDIKKKVDNVNNAPVTLVSKVLSRLGYRKKFKEKPNNPWTTTGQSAKGSSYDETNKNIKDERVIPYENFQKHVITNLVGKTSTEFEGVKGGIYLTAVLGGVIPEKMIQPRNQERISKGELSKQLYDETPLFVITDKSGKFLYFDGDFKVTTAEKGKLMLYDMRTNKASIQNVEDVMNSRGLSKEKAEIFLKDRFETNDKIREYLKKNPKARIKTIIEGGSVEHVPSDIEKPIKVSEITNDNFKIEIDKSPDNLTSTVYMHVNGISEPIRVNETFIEAESAEMIADFLTSAVYKKGPGGKDILVTPTDKIRDLKPILYSDHVIELQKLAQLPDGKKRIVDWLLDPYAGDRAISISKDYGKRIYKFSDPDIRSAPIDRSTGVPVEVMVDGKLEHRWLQKRHWNISKDFEGGNFDKFTLETRTDGGFDMKSDLTAKYDQWVKEHTTTAAQPNANGEIVGMNPYFEYKYDSKDLDIVFDKVAITQKGVEVSDKAPAPDNTPPVEAKRGDISGAIKKLQQRGDLYKEFFQKSKNIKATEEQLKDAKIWWDSHPVSKYFTFTEAFNMVNTAHPSAVASWTTHGVTLFRGADYTDLYHEAWHGFTQMFLTKGDKGVLYKEAGRLSGSFTDYQGKRVRFAEAKEDQLEEYLAEEFRSYVLTGKAPKAGPGTRSTFKKIIDFLRSLFHGISVKDVVTNDMATAHIHELFEKLKVGDLNEFTFNMNNRNFNILNKGIEKLDHTKETQPSLSHTDSREVDNAINYLITDTVNRMNAGISSDAHWAKIKEDYSPVFPDLESERFSEFKKANEIVDPSKREYYTEALLMKYPETRSELFQEVLYRLTNPDGVRAKLDAKIKGLEDGPEKSKLIAKLGSLDWAIRNFGRPAISGDPVKKNGTISYNIKKSPFLTREAKKEIYEELAEDDREVNVYDKRGNKSPLEDMFDPAITSFLKGLYEVDAKTGKPVLSVLDLPKPMDFKVSVNRLSKILGNGIDKDRMYDILSENQKKDPLFTQILNKLGPNYTTNDKAQRLQLLFTKAFDLAHVDLVQLTQHMIDGAIETTYGIASSPVDIIDRGWNTSFALTETDVIRKNAEGNSFLDLGALFAKYPEFIPGQELEFLKSIGMTMSDDANGNIRKALSDRAKSGRYGVKFLYSTLVKAYELQQAGENIRINSIKDIVKGFQAHVDVKTTDPKVYRQLAGFEKRYNAILDLEAQYNDRASHTVTNAKGDSQQDLTVPTFQTHIINNINRSKDWNDLMSYKDMGYLGRTRNYPARYSRVLNSVFDFSDKTRYGNKREEKHIPAIIKFENFSGIGLVENGNPAGGAAITDLSKLDTLIAYRNSFVLAGKPGGPGHGAKNTTFLYSTRLLPKNPNTSHSGQYYVDIAHFVRPADTKASVGRTLANEILIDYINGELNRINIYNGLSAKDPTRFAYPRGGEFNFFHDVLSTNTKEKLMAIEEIKKDPDFTLEDYLFTEGEAQAALHEQITKDLDNYFNIKIKEVQEMFNKIPDTDTTGVNKVLSSEDVRYQDKERIPDAITEAFVYNTWMHNYEGRAIIYGDLAQFAKPKDISKRDGSAGSPGHAPDVSRSTIAYINDKGEMSRPYGYSSWNPNAKTYKHEDWRETMHTAVFEDPIVKAKKYDEIREALKEELEGRLEIAKATDWTEADKKAYVDEATKAFEEMKIADAAAVIAWDPYRLVRISLGNWDFAIHEPAFMKIVNKEPLTYEEAALFGPMKMIHEGYLDTQGLPIIANHKFMLVPMNPYTIHRKKMEVLHNKMVEQGVDYALFKSGSKTGTITTDGKSDLFYTDMKTKGMAFAEGGYAFTKNTIFLKNLREQIPVTNEWSEEQTTSRQLRTLAIADIMDAGAPIDFWHGVEPNKRKTKWEGLTENEKKNKSDVYRIIADYENNLKEKTKKIERQLKKKVGWVEGETVPNIKNLLRFAHDQLEMKNLPEHLIDYVEFNPHTNTPLRSLSLSPNAEEIETTLVNEISKRLTNQKSHGEGYKLVSDVGHESVDGTGVDELNFYARGSIDPVTKKRRATSMAEARLPLHGDFKKLLNVKHRDGRPIGTRERLNALIRDKGWLSEGNHRDLITIAGIRIPGQGMNSIDVLQVIEFLPESSGPIIMMHPEVVAKVGADFDYDSFPAMTPTIRVYKEIASLEDYSKTEALKIYDKVKQAKIEIDRLKDSEGIKVELTKRLHNPDEPFSPTVDLGPYNKLIGKMFGVEDFTELDFEVESALLKEGKLLPFEEFHDNLNGVGAIENRIIGNIKDLAMLPQNYVPLVKPNGTFLLEPHTERVLRPLIEDVNFDHNVQSENEGFSPTRTTEIGYNLGRVSDITSAQQALGITMVSNRWKSLLNRVGFHLNSEYDVMSRAGKKHGTKDLTLHFPHNTYEVNGKKVISLSHVYSANGIDRISDLKSHLATGHVDAETRGDWAAFMQGNREAVPVINFLMDAGVDKIIIQNFVSNPLIRKYLQEQKQIRGPHARGLGKEPRDDKGRLQPNFYKGKALQQIMIGPKYGFNKSVDYIPAYPQNKMDMDKMLKAYIKGEPSIERGIKIDSTKSWGKLKTQPVYTAEGVNTMRTTVAKSNEHFGNPWSEGGYAGTIKLNTVPETVQAYKDWLTTDKYKDVKSEQRKWILEQINSGKLDKATLLYDAKLAGRGLGSHPEALVEVVKELRGTQSIVTGVKEKVNIYAGTRENAELSNFAERPFTIEDTAETYQTVEAAYQASKIAYAPSTESNLKIGDKLGTNITGAEAKNLGRQIKGLEISKWDKDSSSIMKELLLQSFRQNPEALAKLSATGDAILTHTQDKGKWGTEFPRLLMQVRAELLPKIKKESGAKEGPVEFTSGKLLDAVEKGAGREIGVHYEASNIDRAALLHFVEIEEMGKAMRDITMRLTGDSTRSKTLYAAHSRENLIRELNNNRMIPEGMIEKLLTGSPIASFDTNKFVKNALTPLFTLRANPKLIDFVSHKTATEAFRDIPETTGDPEEYSAALINDFVGGYVFQNALRGFKLDEVSSYKGFDAKRVSKTAPIRSLEFGAFVKDKVLYVDKAQLKKDFELRNFSREEYGTIDGKKSLATVDDAAFGVDPNDYYHFVFEREYLRSIYGKKAKEMAATPEEFEEFLRDEALDNVFNPWKVFRSDKSYASQLLGIKKDFPHLESEFDVLKALIVDAEKNKKGDFKKGGLKNIKLATTDIPKDDIDIYHEQLEKLGNSSEVKADTPADNDRISRFFKKMPFMALYQSGMSTKNQFSYVKVIPDDKINRMLEQVSKEYIKELEGPTAETVLNDYYDKFKVNNDRSNYSKYRYKDYVTQRPDVKEDRVPDTFVPVKEGVVKRRLNMKVVDLVKLVETNPDKVFIYDRAISDELTATPDKRGSTMILSDPDRQLGNIYGITTRLDYKINNNKSSHLSDATLEDNKILIEQDIENLRSQIDSGKELVFNEDGYGQALIGANDITGNNQNIARALAPETFNYLSRRLFEEFGYENKNFINVPAGKKVIQKLQPVTDEEIIDIISHCFK